MQAELVTTEQLTLYLDPESKAWEPKEFEVLQSILDATEELLESLTGQVFTATVDAIVDEAHDGSGGNLLFAARPIASLTALTLGRDKGTTLDVADIDELIFWPGTRRIERISSGGFPQGGRNVWLSYTPAALLPDVAVAAVKEVAAKVWKGRGREGVTTLRTDSGLSESVSRRADQSTFWKDAVSTLMIPRLG